MLFRILGCPLVLPDIDLPLPSIIKGYSNWRSTVFVTINGHDGDSPHVDTAAYTYKGNPGHGILGANLKYRHVIRSRWSRRHVNFGALLWKFVPGGLSMPA